MNDKITIDSLHILVVEDNPTDALLLRVALEQVRGVKIVLTHAKRLDEALLRLETEYFDAILLDLGLPDSSGLETFTRTQNHSPRMPILVLSGLDDDTIALTAVRDGAQDYLVKGKLDSAMLARTIRYAIERKRTAEKLIASEMGYRRLFETAQDGIFILDSETEKITDANPFLENLLGYSAAEFIGKKLWEISPFRTQDANKIAFGTLQETGVIQYDDLPLLTKEGRLIEVEFVSNVYIIAGKKLIQCNIRDISERKRADEKLQISEANLRAAQQIARIGSWELDLSDLENINQNSLRWSDEIYRIFGYEPGQIESSNENFFRAVHPDDRARVQEAMAQALRGNAAYGIDHRIVLPGGEVREIHAQAEVICDKVSGVPIKVVGIGQDITERKRGEDALQEAQQLLQSTLDALSSHIAVLDETGEILAVNKVWSRFGEENGGTVVSCGIGANYVEICDAARGEWSAEAPQVAQGIREVMGGRLPMFSLEYPCHSPSQERWFEVRVTRYGGESAVRVVVAHVDITERKQADDALRESDEKFRQLADNISDVFWIRSADMSRVHYVSPAFERIWGRPVESLYARPHEWIDFIYPEDSERVQAAFAVSVQDATSVDVEYRILRPDGEIRWIRSRGFPVRNAEGQVIRHSGIVTDITERKQSEEASALLVAIVESSEDAIISKTLDGIITSWNVGAQNLYGYTAEEAIGRPVSFLAPPELANERPALLAKIRRGEPVKHYETVRVRKDGKRIEISLSLSPIRDAEGNIIGVSSIKRDISQAKRIAQELQDSKERFESIVTNVPGMVYQFVKQPDASLHWAFVGEGFRELFEAGPEILQSTPDWPMDQVHPDDRYEFDRSVTASWEKLLPRSWEGRLHLPSGKIKWIQINSRPQRLPDGGTLWNGVILDVTARKEAEEERDRFFTLSLDMLCIADMNGYFKRLNPAFEKTLGYSDAELMAKPFLEWVHPDDRAATLAVMQELDDGAPTLEFVNRYRCHDGSYRWLSWLSAPYKGLVYAAAHDVTSLKNAQAALHKANDELELNVIERTAELRRANEQLQLEVIERQAAEKTLYKNHEFLQVVLENTAEGIVACDAEGEVTFFNRATREFHGFPLEPVPSDQWVRYYSMYLSDGITPIQTEDAPLFRALSGDHVRNMEMVIAPHEGSPHLLIANGEPLFGAAGEKLGAVVVMHDITDRKQAEVELQRAKQEADTANLAKSEFLSRMSHELRTPLNAVLGFGQILEMNRRLNERDVEAVDHILKSGRHLLGLINEVLDIASIEAGRISISPEPILFSQTIREVLDMVRPLAATRHIQIMNEVAEPDNRHVRADHQRFRQILLNLLANAIKYNCQGGRVTISCAKIGTLIRFNISDTGSGLTANEIGKLFVPFERLAAANSHIEGTGLGLVLCKKLVETMEGHIGVDSVPGEGSTFWVELPLVESQAAQLAMQLMRSGNQIGGSEGANASIPQSSKRTVLYIEDNLSNLKVVEHLLAERPQIKLLSAMQGSIGLDLACQHLPDLILLDLHLPDIPGDVVLHRLRAEPATRQIPIVVLSADATSSQMDRLHATGIEHYLTKPLDLCQFLQVLDKILDKP